jgi:hypothetical protein
MPKQIQRSGSLAVASRFGTVILYGNDDYPAPIVEGSLKHAVEAPFG